MKLGCKTKEEHDEAMRVEKAERAEREREKSRELYRTLGLDAAECDREDLWSSVGTTVLRHVYYATKIDPTHANSYFHRAAKVLMTYTFKTFEKQHYDAKNRALWTLGRKTRASEVARLPAHKPVLRIFSIGRVGASLHLWARTKTSPDKRILSFDLTLPKERQAFFRIMDSGPKAFDRMVAEMPPGENPAPHPAVSRVLSTIKSDESYAQRRIVPIFPTANKTESKESTIDGLLAGGGSLSDQGAKDEDVIM